jgi:DNA (cytosine-5)-methyltransferase 1
MDIHKKTRFIDLFAGAGGFSLGFELAGLELIQALEKDDWAVETLKENHDPSKIVHADITDQLDLNNFRDNKPDIIIGGPPCQGFSFAGPNGDPNDPRNSLFVFFAKWVDFFKPRIFVMENVRGILSRKSASGENISSIIKKTFEEIGYTVDIWILQAAEYGVPQNRIRVFFVGNLLNFHIVPPPTTHYLPGVIPNNNSLKPAITVGEAILDLPKVLAGEGSELQPYDSDPISDFQIWARENSPCVYNHEAMAHTSRIVERFKLVQQGSDLDDIPHDFKVRKRNGNGNISQNKFNSNYRHLKASSISNTIPASFYSSFIHPTLPRNITSREAARLQSFPDNYVFKGRRTLISKKLLQRLGKSYYERLSQYNQIGNAVPPLLSKAIASHLNDLLQVHISKKSEIKNDFTSI